LTADAAGNLFGTTAAGGASSEGVVFELTGSGFVPVPEPAGLPCLTARGAVLFRRRKPIQGRFVPKRWR
jgi:uncharacterized repeat protein (TIGR03803 family)